MLPKYLSENICSLKKNEKRIVFTLDIEIKNYSIVNYSFCNSLIIISENFIYDEKKLLKNEHYKLILSVIQNVNRQNELLLNNKYSINNSVELITFLMILMNYYSSIKINNNGIYRICNCKNYNENNNLPKEIKSFITYWKNTDSYYNLEKGTHHSLNLDSYIHITSPIRRIIDILNMYKLQQIMNIVDFSENAHLFYEKWTNKINIIDNTFKLIKKIQKNCLLLHTCLKNEKDKEYDCYIINYDLNKNNEINAINECDIFIYQIYIPEIKLVSSIKTFKQYTLYGKYTCKIYIFELEKLLQKKIRIDIIG